MKHATLLDNKTRHWENFVSANVNLSDDQFKEFSGSPPSVALFPLNDLYEDWSREYHNIREHEAQQLGWYGTIIETKKAVQEASTGLAFKISWNLLLTLKLSALQNGIDGGVKLRKESADVGHELLVEVASGLEESPILYTSPDGGLIIDFLHRDKRLTLVIDDNFCIFTLTKDGTVSQSTVDLPTPSFFAETRSYLQSFSSVD